MIGNWIALLLWYHPVVLYITVFVVVVILFVCLFDVFPLCFFRGAQSGSPFQHYYRWTAQRAPESHNNRAPLFMSDWIKMNTAWAYSTLLVSTLLQYVYRHWIKIKKRC